MHQSLTSERREEVTKDGLISCHPCPIGRIALLDGLLVVDDCDILVRLLLFTGEKIIELHHVHGGQNLGMPQGVVGFCQLLADWNDEDEGDGGGR
jgi:hypothetical protein